MFQSLLVPLDGSEFSERSLPLARGIAQATGAVIHLAHVHVPHVPDHFLSNTQFHFEGLDLDAYDAKDRASEVSYLGDLGAKIKCEGAAVDQALLEGEVVDELVAYAERIDCDAILMSTHGHSGLSRFWIGSVADALVRRTHRPIIVHHSAAEATPPDAAQGVGHILVALDGSEMSESILAPTLEIAESSGSRLTLLHVVPTQREIGIRLLPISPDALMPAKERMLEYLETIAEEIRAARIEVETRVESHDAPAVAISQAAERLGADLIAMATHGYRGLTRAFLGSVADKVLRGSPRPLMLVRPTSSHPEGATH